MVDDVIIPAAGLGTRMYPVTENKYPKLMLKVRGKPLISWAIEEAISSGFERIHVVVNKKDSEVIGNLLIKEYTGINVILTDNTKGSAHTILKAEEFVRRNFFGTILPDIFIEGDIPAMLQIKMFFEKGKSNTIGWLELSQEQRKVFGKSEDIALEKLGDDFFKVKEIFPADTVSETKHYIARYITSKYFFEITKQILDKDGSPEDSKVLQRLFTKENFYGGRLLGHGFDLGNPEGYKKYLESNTS